MKPKVGSYTFHVESYACDFRGKATLPVIGNFLLRAATIHAQERGFGYEAIVKDHTAWVLSRMSLEMYEYPEHDQDLTVETWVEDVTRLFTQRCLRFIDSGGKVVGYARTIWAAIDMETRRPKDILSWRPDLSSYIAEDVDCPIAKPGKIPNAAGEPAMGYAVRYSDIDINCHVNSIKYIEHTIDAFGLEMFQRNTIRRFEIIYMAEATFGDKLKLYKEEAAPGAFVIDTKKDEESVCRCRIEWEGLKA